MRCAERERLIKLLTNAVLGYTQAVRSQGGAEGEAIRHAREWSDMTHAFCEDCREVLAEHERTHGCVATNATVAIKAGS